MHFIMLFDELDTDMDMEDGLMLQQLLEIHILDHIETVERISSEAQKQHNLKTQLAAMKRDWKIWNGIFMLSFIAFYFFVVVNAVTSYFVESARQHGERDQEHVVHRQVQRKREYEAKLETLFAEMDDDGSGDVSLEEFLKHLREPTMLAFAQSLDLDATDLEQFFSILSVNGKRPVDLETFVMGCIKLRGMARSVDLIDMLLSQKTAIAEMHKAQRLNECHHRKTENMLHQISKIQVTLSAPRIRIS